MKQHRNINTAFPSETKVKQVIKVFIGLYDRPEYALSLRGNAPPGRPRRPPFLVSNRIPRDVRPEWDWK